ncbi:MAG: DNA-3-methyladenine glycosylase [Pseudomonadota bacterium]|nr:DNA-3-methyladenine glycosylase [Pseudomonadota bacterium]
MTRLVRAFFDRPTLEVARDLIGVRFCVDGVAGRITETEAYIGQDDPACHAARGQTARNAVMFGPSGMAYVYFIYGMYHCLNMVTERDGFPAAVLVRGIKLEDGRHLDGPGKLCRDLGIDKADNGADLISGERFRLEDDGIRLPFIAGPRVGISKGADLPWRFRARIL